jgi:hypothetical protein
MRIDTIPFTHNGKDYAIVVEQENGRYTAQAYSGDKPATAVVSSDVMKASTAAMETGGSPYADIVEVIKDNIRQKFNVK